MYQEFYGLRDIPFSLAPDPRYLFRTESLLEVFANLQYGIENGKGIVVVTGEVGCGKTTILRSMLQSLDRSVLAAYIFNPLLSTEEFFDLLASEFRLPPQASKAAMLRTLGHVLNRPTALVMPAFAARLAFGEMADEESRAGYFRVFESRDAACEWLSGLDAPA